MYAEGTMSREEFRRTRREQVQKEQRTKRRRILVFFVTLVVMFGIGVGFGTLLAKAEEPETETEYKYYTSIEIQKGDTLWEIAKEYINTDHYKDLMAYMNEVMKINHMTTDRLTAGKKIIIPYYSSEIK
ncbi:MAG: LysM peptidoglycan-binding domain-containing protein [Lachnospiraceae bacterium]|jgi:FOG: LysM repeat|nr:LysM peptidoglycan-binding domain-containing protein [Lachnospiraceae bacterium]